MATKQDVIVPQPYAVPAGYRAQRYCLLWSQPSCASRNWGVRESAELESSKNDT